MELGTFTVKGGAGVTCTIDFHRYAIENFLKEHLRLIACDYDCLSLSPYTN